MTADRNQFVLGIDYMLDPQLVGNRIVAVTNRDAPHRRVVEIGVDESGNPEWSEIVAECEMVIHDWLVAGNGIFLRYARGTSYQIQSFDLSGRRVGEIPVRGGEQYALSKTARERMKSSLKPSPS
jgi:hypothetical protein